MAAVKKISTKQRTLRLITSLDPEEDDDRTATSKKISWILRRGAKVAGVDITPDGWVKLADILKAEIMEGVSREHLMQVIIDSNGKKLRYELVDAADGEVMIKAYSKEERKAKELAAAVGCPDTTTKSDSKSLRQDAKPFVPNEAGTDAATNCDYAYGYAGMGYNPWVLAQYMQWLQSGGGGKFHGRVKSYNPDKGFGFIECYDTFSMYGRDVFLHKAQAGDIAVGTAVTFTCEPNKNGMPQAKNVQVAQSKGAKGKGKGKGKKGGDQATTPVKGAGKKKLTRKATDGTSTTADGKNSSPEAKAVDSPDSDISSKIDHEGSEGNAKDA